MSFTVDSGSMIVLVVLLRLVVTLLVHQEEKARQNTAQGRAARVCIEVVRQPLVVIAEVLNLEESLSECDGGVEAGSCMVIQCDQTPED